MYNRYVPQPDGSFRRNRLPEQKGASPAPQSQPQSRVREEKAGDFLRNLLPKELDTGDLLVILLLLLMAGDAPEDRNSALLTLGMYLFL